MSKLKSQAMLIMTSCITAVGAMSPAPQTLHAEEQAKNQAEKPEADDVNISLLSEAFGHFIGRNLKSPGVTFDIDAVIKGLKNGAAGQPAPMSDQDYELAMAKLQEKAFAALSEQNLANAKEFLEKNAKEPGVVEIESGKLQYQIIKPGSGEEVKPHSTPLIHYSGKYQDGTVFGSSEEVGGPITIPLDQTIPGFSKGLLGMKEGEKRKLFIHPDLGYGTMGNLPPNALLIFEIEVVKANASDLNIQSMNSEETETPHGKSSLHEDDEDDRESGKDADKDDEKEDDDEKDED